MRSHESIELLNHVRAPCVDDFALLCGGASSLVFPGAGLQCLKDSVDALRAPSCRAAVNELMATTSEDALLDPPACLSCPA